ncbi:Parathyroid hormone [Channa argus]|uniref:Parathyroid hormone n=1 Tax=Channa argus TaxID=215402 RepID=A0A6G1P8T1_CHAAH|nr:Parathyroid hormone [Channa argus]
MGQIAERKYFVEMCLTFGTRQLEFDGMVQPCSLKWKREAGKRTISEVQLMHNFQEHKQVGERQDWLQEKLKKIIVASTKPQHGQSGIIKNDIFGSNMWKS